MGSSCFPWPGTAKRHEPEPGDTLLQDLFQAFVFVGCGALSRILLFNLNDTKVLPDNGHAFASILSTRSLRRAPLITVTNHNSTIDDPVLLSALAPFRVLADPQRCCWSWCASEICFANPVYSQFFHHVKTIPITRGNGIRQPAVGRMISYGLRGSWLHVFPEGKVIQKPGGGQLQIHPLRWGVGKLVTEISNIRDKNIDPLSRPILLPFVHRGMQDVLPLKTYVPKINNKVRVLFGEAIPYDDLIEEHVRRNSSRLDWNDPTSCVDEELYAKITQRVELELRRLNDELNRIINEE